MSEGCNGCKSGKYASNSNNKLSLNVCNTCSNSSTDSCCDSCSTCLGKNRVQVRAKVLYGSGVAIANLRAKEKTTNRPNL